MAGLSASGLKTQIRSYTETDSTVLSDSVLENIILNAQYRIFRDVPIDADRKQQTGNLVVGQETINAPAGCVFIRALQVYDSTSATTGANVFLEKKTFHIYKNMFHQLNQLKEDNLNIMLCLVVQQESLTLLLEE